MSSPVGYPQGNSLKMFTDGTYGAGNVPVGITDKKLVPLYATLSDGRVGDAVPGIGSSVVGDRAGLAVTYHVEAFRVSGVANDSAVINLALARIRADNPRSSKLMFESGRLYTYSATGDLGDLCNLEIDGNGCFFKRANASVNTTTLSSATPDSATVLPLSSVPDSWAVNDLIAVCQGTTNADLSTVVRITAIDRTAKTVNVNKAPTFGATIFPAGATVIKSFSLFAGVPSLSESNAIWPQGSNKNVSLHDFVLDGNVSNQINFSWRINTEIALHTEGGRIYNARFQNTANECIVGHGFDVGGGGRCTFVDLGGSAVHLSCNDATKDLNHGATLRGNLFRRTNLKTQAVSGHSEGAITFSWGPGTLTVVGNDFDGGSEPIMGNINTSAGANGMYQIIFSANNCRGYSKIFAAVGSTATYGIAVTGNSFDACGDNTALGTLPAPANVIRGNSISGGTILPQSSADGWADFVPTISGSATAGVGTYTLQKGRYTKIGDVVNFVIALKWTAHTGTGNTNISGLPYAAKVDSGLITPVNIMQAGGPAPGAGKQRIAIIPAGQSVVGLREFDPATAGITNANPMTTSGEFYIFGAYKV